MVLFADFDGGGLLRGPFMRSRSFTWITSLSFCAPAYRTCHSGSQVASTAGDDRATGYRRRRRRGCWLSWNERELLLALLQHKCGGRLKNLLGWVLFSPSSHPDIDCRPIGPNVVAAVFVRLPVRPADEAPQPPLIAGSLIKKFPFLGTFYRCVRSRRVIMNR